MENQELKSNENDLVGALHYVQSLATKENNMVVVKVLELAIYYAENHPVIDQNITVSNELEAECIKIFDNMNPQR